MKTLLTALIILAAPFASADIIKIHCKTQVAEKKFRHFVLLTDFNRQTSRTGPMRLFDGGVGLEAATIKQLNFRLFDGNVRGGRVTNADVSYIAHGFAPNGTPMSLRMDLKILDDSGLNLEGFIVSSGSYQTNKIKCLDASAQ